MPRHLSVCRIVFLVVSLATAGSLFAQQKTPAKSPPHKESVKKPEKGPAYTQPPQDDPNFALQGEFIGPVTVGKNKYQPLGLQIRPVGRDMFEAVSFVGGLPGEKTHKPKPVKMIGRRSGDFVVLSGGPWAIFAEKDHCTIIDREGNKIGRLDRIERSSTTMGAKPPKGAIVLFDGTNVDHFTNAQMTKDGLLAEGADFKPMFQDFNIHLEFRLPYLPAAEGQSRANSGVYLQNRYECQILDSFAQDRLINGCGALYRFRKPDVNMCFPPLVWQTYDIQFTAPRWAADGSKLRDAHVSSWINGVQVQKNVALANKTGAGKKEEPLLLPSRLQNHGDPVRFRNIWVVDRGLAPGTPFPVRAAKKKKIETVLKAKPEVAKPDAAKPAVAKPDVKKPAEKPEGKAKAGP